MKLTIIALVAAAASAVQLKWTYGQDTLAAQLTDDYCETADCDAQTEAASAVH